MQVLTKNMLQHCICRTMCGNAANGQKLKNKRSECNVTVDVAVYEFIFRAIKVQRIVDSGWVFE